MKTALQLIKLFAQMPLILALSIYKGVLSMFDNECPYCRTNNITMVETETRLYWVCCKCDREV